MYSYLMLQNLKDFKKKIELSLQRNPGGFVPKAEPMDTVEPIGSALAGAYKELQKGLDSERYISEIIDPVDNRILKKTNEYKYSSPQLILCNLELKILNECIKNNKIEKIKCDKLFYDYIKCDELITSLHI